MSKATLPVFADALRLDPDTRAELAAELLASLDGPADPDADAAWAAEIDRRVEAIESGSLRLESWDQAKRRIEKEILGR
jgi:putative addiction module component (TIGR02574 family)